MSPVLVTHHLLEAIFNPFMFGFLLFTLSVLWFLIYGDSVKVRCCFLVVLVGLLVSSTGWVPMYMTSYLRCQYPVVTKVNPKVQWVVVLGGGVREHIRAPINYLLSGASIQRVLEGVRLYRLLPGSKLLLSGGGDFSPAMSVAARMSTFAAWFEIPASDRVLETVAINTAEEAVEIKRWVHQEPFYLVTSSMHMPRAMALCHKQGLNPIAAPADFPFERDISWYEKSIPSSGNIDAIRYAWHELLGQLWGKVTGLI